MKRIKRLGIVLCFLLCIYEYAQGKTEFRIMDESAEEQELQLITERIHSMRLPLLLAFRKWRRTQAMMNG